LLTFSITHGILCTMSNLVGKKIVYKIDNSAFLKEGVVKEQTATYYNIDDELLDINCITIVEIRGNINESGNGNEQLIKG